MESKYMYQIPKAYLCGGVLGLFLPSLRMVLPVGRASFLTKAIWNKWPVKTVTTIGSSASILFCLSILLGISGDTLAASFDCKKSTTAHEKLICSSEILSDADKEMGEAYRSAVNEFPMKDLIQLDQKGWLMIYRDCSSVEECFSLVRKRRNELNYLRSAEVYANTPGNKFTSDLGIIFVHGNDKVKLIRLYGAWMPNAYMDPKDIKGYPYDGVNCNNDLVLTRKGSRFIARGEDDLSFIFHKDKIVVEGTYMCSPRTGFGRGTYWRKE